MQQSGQDRAERFTLSSRCAQLDYAHGLSALYLRPIGKPLPLLKGYCLQQFPLARTAIEAAAQNVSDVRSHFPKATLATLYDPDLMPPDLVKAHERLDRAVDAAYVPDGGKRKWASDAERVAFLFRRYRELDSLLPDQRSRSRSEGTKRSRRGEV